ncbi:MAG: hypothetical protein PHQ49_05245 [Clostridia bacterium]|jgi:hypothetical protein|nr:hypothetical protein [Clostridia bacterium]
MGAGFSTNAQGLYFYPIFLSFPASERILVLADKAVLRREITLTEQLPKSVILGMVIRCCLYRLC